MKSLLKNEEGISLIEVLVALAILALIGVGFLSALATSSKAIIIADTRTTAESLARSQMEYVKDQPYSVEEDWSYKVSHTGLTELALGIPDWWDPPVNPPDPPDNPPLLSAIYSGYSVEVKAEDFDADGDGYIDGDDAGIRRITVSIYHNDYEQNNPPLLVLEDYKVLR